MPPAWAHAEYIKLVCSATNRAVFERIPEIAQRYLARHGRSDLEILNFYRQIDAVAQSVTLRIILASPFRLPWSNDAWSHAADTASLSTVPGLFYVELSPLMRPGAFQFTFFRPELQQWQNLDYRVNVI